MANILLLEPNQLLARSYAQVLESAGHRVRHYARGQSAIEAADSQTPDIVVLELQITGHNGLEFLYEFRSYPEWQEIPVIVQSVVPRHIVEGAAAVPHLGISKYLYKPTTKLSDLTKSVEEVLNTAAL